MFEEIIVLVLGGLSIQAIITLVIRFALNKLIKSAQDKLRLQENLNAEQVALLEKKILLLENTQTKLLEIAEQFDRFIEIQEQRDDAISDLVEEYIGYEETQD